MERRPLCLVFAMSDDRVIGEAGGLPWNIPEDLKHFKKVTMGHAVVMGRVTYESMGKPLPGRRNIVITRDPSRRYEGAEVATSLEDALRLAYQKDAEPIVLGGAEIFALALPIATKMIVTYVHRDVEGDTRFPEFDLAEWREVWRRTGEANRDVEFVELVRK
ncbi:MAG TPA: dihydrofolate reductase [Polyangiaceae bacterium]|nr:dihydrofolate reductase [Polyangiaceae bacterium]